MNYLLASGMAFAALSVQAAPLDCGALANAAGREPPGYAMQCLGFAPVKADEPFNGLDHLLGELSQAYAVQINPNQDYTPQGFYGFALDDFANAERIGTTQMSNVFGLDFNTAATRLYATQMLPNNVGARLGTFDLSTGEFEPITFVRSGGLPFTQSITGFAIDPRTGDAWVSTINILTNNPQLSEAYLWRLDIATGNTAYMGRLLSDDANPVFIDIAVNCAGEMYAHNITDDALYRINPETAEATLIGTHGLPANFAQGMDFDNATGELYAWIYTGGGANTLGRFDLDSGAFTSLTNGPSGQWEGAIDTQCDLKTIDPEALTGAWYAPYTEGQGFTARYYADNGSVFMPWFTFSREGGDEVSEQRWYSLFGPVGDGVTDIELPILQTLGGRFDQPPAVAPIQVGQARLSFYSCFEGVLEYQFDPEHNGGAQGRISMTRLLPSSADCTEFDGDVVEAEAQYDPDLTGSWYDPETPGQGLELYRVTPSSGVLDFLYGAWFTFEPNPEQSGPAAQRWFTLNGQTVNDDGTITTTIARTLGGSFDDEIARPAARVGQAVLKSESCDTLVLTYEFDDTENVGDFQDLSGEIVFRRLGACTPEE